MITKDVDAELVQWHHCHMTTSPTGVHGVGAGGCFDILELKRHVWHYDNNEDISTMSYMRWNQTEPVQTDTLSHLQLCVEIQCLLWEEVCSWLEAQVSHLDMIQEEVSGTKYHGMVKRPAYNQRSNRWPDSLKSANRKHAATGISPGSLRMVACGVETKLPYQILPSPTKPYQILPNPTKPY